MKLTEHFTLQELTASQYAARHGIDNTPPDEAIGHLMLLCVHVLEPLREILGRAIVINSGYRCDELNRAVGGKSDSQHRSGEAADIVVPGLTPLQVFNIAAREVPFDQCIKEFDKWVHLSYRAVGRRDTRYIELVDGHVKDYPVTLS